MRTTSPCLVYLVHGVPSDCALLLRANEFYADAASWFQIPEMMFDVQEQEHQLPSEANASTSEKNWLRSSNHWTQRCSVDDDLTVVVCSLWAS